MFNLNKTINKTRVWKKLEAHAKKMRNVEMRDMFDEDNKRAEKYSVSLENMWLDYSKNRIATNVGMFFGGILLFITGCIISPSLSS